MIAPTTIKAYIAELVTAFRKIELMDFLQELHTRSNPDQDLSFMEYFLELCAEENEGQFIVHHEKLIEFKVATSKQSNHVKTRLGSLGLTEGEEYLLTDVREQLPNGAKHTKVYFLTPEAFKLCLMRAQKRSNQTTDVQMYAKYFLFIEKVVKYYSDYQRDLADAFSLLKDDRIDRLERTIIDSQETLQRELAERDVAQVQRDEDHRMELSHTVQAMREEANRQRAEILGETKAAHTEVKKARQDISELHDTVVTQHETTLEMAQHSSVEVPRAKRQYFVMTSYQRVGDASGTLYFRNWRRQANKLIPLLVSAMSDSWKDKDDIEFTAHQLVIPPIYSPGAVNVGNAGKKNLDVFVKNKVAELNRGVAREDRTTIGSFKEMIGLTSSSLYPVWTDNDHLSHCQFVDCYLDEIKKSKIVKLSVSEPVLQERLDKQVRKQLQDLTNATGKAREDLMKMIEKVRAEMETPPSSENEQSDATDGEQSDDE